jgi:O-antigen ligase
MLTAIAFTLFNCTSYFFALYRAPLWGLIAYMNIYFNTPNPRINWWANYLPIDRWSLVTTAVLLASIVIHWGKTSKHEFSSAKWLPWFFALSIIISYTNAINKEITFHYLYLLFTYGLIIFVIVKSLVDFQQLRIYLLAMIGFAGYLSIAAYMYGERVNARLEQFGTADANTSNEFALLLAGVMPFIFAFVKSGKKYERVISLIALPFVINAFILCNSRGSTVALAGAVIAAVLLVADNKMRKKVLIALVFVIPAFVYLTDDEFNSRVTTLIGIGEAIEDESTARSLSSGRTEIWLYGLEMAKDNPLGVGPNGFKELARFYMPPDVLTFRSGVEYGVRSAHNTYLQVLVEQGVLGLILWLGMCLHTCLILLRSFKMTSTLDEDRTFWRDNVFALNVSFLAVLIAGMINSRVYFEFFWWQIAIAVVVYALFRQVEQKALERIQSGSEDASRSGKLRDKRPGHGRRVR